MGAELGAVDERDRFRDRLEGDAPVDCRVTAAHDYHIAIAERFDPFGEVVNTSTFQIGNARRGVTLRFERADPGRDDHRFAQPDALGGLHPDQAVFGSFEPGDFFLEAHIRRAARVRLLDELLDEVLGENLRVAADIVDVLFRVDRGQRAARLFERINDAYVGATHRGVECGKKAGRTRSDDGYIGDVANDRQIVFRNDRLVTHPFSLHGIRQKFLRRHCGQPPEMIPNRVLSTETAGYPRLCSITKLIVRNVASMAS